MTATEFAKKMNTAYPAVAKWLRDGKVPGAFLHKLGNMEIWMIPGDVLKDFVRPEMGRPPLTDEEKAARVERKAAKKDARGKPSVIATKPKTGSKKTAKKAAKKKESK